MSNPSPPQPVYSPSLAPAPEEPITIGGAMLVCIDMQPMFIRIVADGVRVQRRCALAIAATRGLGLPIIFTEQVPDKLGATAAELTALAPHAPALGKKSFSALANSEIREAITGRHRAEHLLICGIETPVCVYQTAIAAIAAGLQVTILSDAVGARRTDDAQFCLAALARSGVHILPTETVFYSLLHDVTHPFFKSYTQLVKSHG